VSCVRVRVRLRCKSMPGLDSQSRETRGARHHNGASQLDTAAAGAMENIILYYYCCCYAKDGTGVVVRGDVGGRKKKIPFPRKHADPSEFLCSRDEKNRRSNVPSLQLFSLVLLYNNNNNNNIKRCVYDTMQVCNGSIALQVTHDGIELIRDRRCYMTTIRQRPLRGRGGDADPR